MSAAVRGQQGPGGLCSLLRIPEAVDTRSPVCRVVVVIVCRAFLSWTGQAGQGGPGIHTVRAQLCAVVVGVRVALVGSGMRAAPVCTEVVWV